MTDSVVSLKRWLLTEKGKANMGVWDFIKAFDTISHSIFVNKTSSVQIDHNMMGEQLAEASGSITYSKWG